MFGFSQLITVLCICMYGLCPCACVAYDLIKVMLLLLLLLLVVVVFNGFGITVNDGDYTTTGSPGCVDHIPQHSPTLYQQV